MESPPYHKNLLIRGFYVILSGFIYLPIIIGLVSVMISSIAIAGIFIYLYWVILAQLFHFLKIDGNASLHYFVGFIFIGTDIDYIIIIISIFLSIMGLILFFGGIIQIAYAKKDYKTIVKTNLYRIVRHPQNLGIIFISVSVFIFIPTTWNIFGDPSSYYIRVGDFYSLILFILIWLFEAYWEENSLLKNFSGEFSEYKCITPFIIPFGKKLENFYYRITPNWVKNLSFYKKILILLCVYFLFILLFSVFFQSNIIGTF